MTLSEDELEAVFPLGAVCIKNRWRPAKRGEKAEKTLGELVQEKWDRRPKDRYLPRDSTRGSTDNVEMAMGTRTSDTRDKRTGRRLEPEPARTDEVDESRWVAENQEKDRLRAEAKPLSERVAALEAVARRDQLRSIEKRIRQVERAMNEKAA